MPISEKTLRKWRKDALSDTTNPMRHDPTQKENKYWELQERILRLTQELMDILLMRKGR